MTAEEMARVIDETITRIRDSIGDVGRRCAAHVYEGDDGRWVSTDTMTVYEAYCVHVALFGKEIADENYATERNEHGHER